MSRAAVWIGNKRGRVSVPITRSGFQQATAGDNGFQLRTPGELFRDLVFDSRLSHTVGTWHLTSPLPSPCARQASTAPESYCTPAAERLLLVYLVLSPSTNIFNNVRPEWTRIAVILRRNSQPVSPALAADLQTVISVAIHGSFGIKFGGESTQSAEDQGSPRGTNRHVYSWMLKMRNNTAMSDGEDDVLWRLVVRRRLSHDGAAARVSITKDTKPHTASGQRVLGSSIHTVYKGSL